MLKVKVPIVFLGKVGFSPPREGRYLTFQRALSVYRVWAGRELAHKLPFVIFTPLLPPIEGGAGAPPSSARTQPVFSVRAGGHPTRLKDTLGFSAPLNQS
jgi:hypothetical protein